MGDKSYYFDSIECNMYQNTSSGQSQKMYPSFISGIGSEKNNEGNIKNIFVDRCSTYAS